MSAVSFLSLLSLCGDILTIGQASKALARNAERSDVEQFITFLETRKVLYAQIDQESKQPVIKSLEEIKGEAEKLRAKLGDPSPRASVARLIRVMSAELNNLWAYDTSHRNGQMKMFMSLQRFRTEMARTLAQLCYLYGVDPASTELQALIVNMATVRPIQARK